MYIIFRRAAALGPGPGPAGNQAPGAKELLKMAKRGSVLQKIPALRLLLRRRGRGRSRGEVVAAIVIAAVVKRMRIAPRLWPCSLLFARPFRPSRPAL